MTHLRLNSAPTYWACGPGWSWHSRPLADHLLWHVLDGVGSLTVAGHRHDLGPGAAAVFAPGDTPVAEHDPHRRLLVFGLHFDTDDPGTVLPGRCVQLRERSLVAALARRCDSGFRRGDLLGVRQALLCLEQILLVVREDAAHPAPDPVDAALEEITRAIREDPARRWSVAELAGRAALSRAQFTRRFVAHTGFSPARFLIDARIARARQLLSETTMSVTQVAGALGYPDVAYFSRQFKRHTGHSPIRTRDPNP